MKKSALILSILIVIGSITGCNLKCKHSSTTPATCIAGEMCNDCGEILGEAKGHNWKLATCTAPKTCSLCEETEGTAKGHSWKSATCQAPKTCSLCYKKEGNVSSHYYQNGYCKYCYATDPTYLDIKNNNILTIDRINFDINSVGGVEVNINFINKSNKQIAYVVCTVKFYDRMGNPAYCQIKHTHTQRLKLTGPINAGSFKNGHWDPVIYCSSTAVVKPLTVEIEYTDGTKQTISSNGRYWYDDSFYGGSLKD